MWKTRGHLLVPKPIKTVPMQAVYNGVLDRADRTSHGQRRNFGPDLRSVINTLTQPATRLASGQVRSGQLEVNATRETPRPR